MYESRMPQESGQTWFRLESGTQDMALLEDLERLLQE